MEKRATASRAAVWAGMLGIYFIWGSTYIAIQVSVQTIPPFLMTGIRNLLAGFILYSMRRLSGEARPTKEEWRKAFVVGILMIAGGSGLVVWSQKTVPSGIAALTVGSAPLWFALLDFMGGAGTRHHRPRPMAVAGLVVGFFGIVLLVGPSKLTGIQGDIDPAGAAALLFGAFFWAFGSLRSRNAVAPNASLMGPALQMICGGAGLVLAGLSVGEVSDFDPARVTGLAAFGFVYLVLIGSLVGFSIYSWLLRSAPTTLVSTYAYVNPIVAIALGVLLLDETLNARVLVSSATILVSVAAVTMSGKRREKA